MSDEIIIRHATLSDVDSFRELRLEALQNHPTAFGADYAENILKPQAYWQERLTINHKEQALFFAEKDRQLIGITGIFRSMSKKSLHSASIWGVYVRPQWRGRNISETLIKSCLKWAKDQGITIVKLAVVTTNQPAIRCYEHCGFTIYGTEPRAIHYESIYYDEYLLSINIEN